MTNEERACFALSALDTFRRLCGCGSVDCVEDIEEGIGDLIGDLLHLAAARKLDPLRLVQHGVSHYAVECVEDDGMFCEAHVDLCVGLKIYGNSMPWRPFSPDVVKSLRKQAEKAMAE